MHFGKFVAESKFVQDRAAFEPLAAAGDVEGMHALLATIAVEDSVCRAAPDYFFKKKSPSCLTDATWWLGRNADSSLSPSPSLSLLFARARAPV